jgi:hypothetical protein
MDLPLTYREDMTKDELIAAFIEDGNTRADAEALAAVALGDTPDSLPVL